uniref:CDK2 associated cullin domain 1 n=1 Tax=Scleropages formosus TaxID=113540 RepID=A0A8C9VER6_SCLFO
MNIVAVTEKRPGYLSSLSPVVLVRNNKNTSRSITAYLLAEHHFDLRQGRKNKSVVKLLQQQCSVLSVLREVRKRSLERKGAFRSGRWGSQSLSLCSGHLLGRSRSTMEEGMEEDSYDEVADDHNHNKWEAAERSALPGAIARYPEREEEPVHHLVHRTSSLYGLCSAEPSGDPSVASKGGINMNSSASKFLMNVMTREDYKSTYWPKLERAIDQLLTQSPVDYIPISYEQIYSCVYKCVCQQHSELMYNDLIWKISTHLEHVSDELRCTPPESLIENFNSALTRYMAALQSIVPIFIYMNKFYIETKLNRDLRDDLIQLFTHHVAEKHVDTLMPLLLKAHSTPFQITPSTMASIVKGLYTLRPDWVKLAPVLFSNFIPQIHPPARESELLIYAAQDQKLQRELAQNGFARGDQSRKRAGDELAYSK